METGSHCIPAFPAPMFFAFMLSLCPLRLCGGINVLPRAFGISAVNNSSRAIRSGIEVAARGSVLPPQGDGGDIGHEGQPDQHQEQEGDGGTKQ